MITVIITVCVYSTIVTVFFFAVGNDLVSSNSSLDFLWVVIAGPVAWLLQFIAFIIRTIRKHQKRKREKMGEKE